MKILRYSLGQLQANCYFLIEERDCLIIDPADEGGFILEDLQRKNLKLVGMLATHGHFDHLMAVGEIQQSIKTPLYIHKDDNFLIGRLEQTAKHFLGYKSIILPIKIIKNFPPLPRFRWASKFQIILTPGHTPGSICYYFEKEKVVFTGDTLFKGSIGRYDFSYSNKKDLKNSLLALFKLPQETIIYPGHGEETTIKEERNNLPDYINLM